jgi:HSP20 family protein
MYRIVRYQNPRATFSDVVRSPWSGLEQEVNRLFSSALADLATPMAPQFPVDLYEDKDNTYVRAELPGISRESINVEMVEDYLNLSVEQKTGEGDNESTLSFNRSIAIPEAVQADKVSATFENGVLTVTLPKQEQAKPRKIAINVN